jgi:hypothetical protein
MNVSDRTFDSTGEVKIELLTLPGEWVIGVIPTRGGVIPTKMSSVYDL